jgi:hypothetical protein
MKKKWCVFVLIFGIILGVPGTVMADYSISWFNIGSRAYEDGTHKNQMNLEIFDENGITPTMDIIQSVRLTGPTGEEFPLDDLSFNVTPAMGYNNHYDGWRGLWYHEGYFDDPYSDYTATLPNNLAAGVYTLTVTDINGTTHTVTDEYTGKMNLPIIPSSSIKTKYDSKGNLLIRWAGIYPGFPYVLDPYMETSIRVCIGTDQSWWQLMVPANMNSAIIPKNIIDEIKSVGSGHYLLLQYRQQSNCNRSYSSGVSLP